MTTIKLLMLGDVSRPASCDYLAEKLWTYRKENEIDFAVVNGENSAEGNGIDILKIVHDADERMYEDKKRGKESREYAMFYSE